MKRVQSFQEGKSPAQAIVEFALVLPILLLLIYGIIEAGRALFIYANLSAAALGAARYGAAVGISETARVPLYQDCAGMRAAAQRFDFLDNFEDAEVRIWHDNGEGQEKVEYCTPGMKTDSSFTPSAGNSSRVGVEIRAPFTPLLPFLPFQPFAISAANAHTILVNVPIKLEEETLGEYPSGVSTPAPAAESGDSLGVPTSPSTAAAPRSQKTDSSAVFCDPRHGRLAYSPFGMIIYNYSPAVTIHIQSIQVWGGAAGASQTLQRITLGGEVIWSGSLPVDSPAYVDEFIGNAAIPAHTNKILQIHFRLPYRPSGSEKIVAVFEEESCPKLDSSNAAQLP